MMNSVLSEPVWEQLDFYRQVSERLKEDDGIPAPLHALVDGVIQYQRQVKEVLANTRTEDAKRFRLIAVAEKMWPAVISDVTDYPVVRGMVDAALKEYRTNMRVDGLGVIAHVMPLWNLGKIILKSFPRHYGRPGKVGGSLPKGQGMAVRKPNPPMVQGREKIPKLPQAKYNGTAGEVAARSSERAKIMETHYGVKFSLHVGNLLGIKAAKAAGHWWAGLPNAVYDARNTKPIRLSSDKEAALMDAYRGLRESYDYVTTNDLKFGTGLGYSEIFSHMKWMYEQDPNSISWGVDRLGKPVHVKFAKALSHK